jgi:phytol kinase
LLELLLYALPSPHIISRVGPLAIIYCVALGWLVGRLRIERAVRTSYTRKIFHFGIFTMATFVHLVWRLPGVSVLGIVCSCVVLYAVWRGEGFPLYEALARPSDAPHRTLFIVVPLITTAAGGILTNAFFGPIAFVGYMVCGWGDAVGEPVGTRWGRHPYRVPSLGDVPAVRTLEGSAAVFIVGSMAAIIALYAFGYPIRQSLAVGVACGFAGALVEAVSNHGLDNLTTQVAAAAVAALLT